MADDVSAGDAPEEEEKKLSKAELIARAKQHFEMIQKVRIYGGLKMQDKLAVHLGIPVNRLSLDRLQRLEQLCKRSDISRGSTYVERGLLYGCSIYETEMGYRVGYLFLCPNREEQDGDALVG
jgi:hypothetical protein